MLGRRLPLTENQTCIGWVDKVCNVFKWIGIGLILLGSPLIFMAIYSLVSFKYPGWFSFLLTGVVTLLCVVVLVSGKGFDFFLFSDD